MNQRTSSLFNAIPSLGVRAPEANSSLAYGLTGDLALIGPIESIGGRGLRGPGRLEHPYFFAENSDQRHCDRENEWPQENSQQPERLDPAEKREEHEKSIHFHSPTDNVGSQNMICQADE